MDGLESIAVEEREVVLLFWVDVFCLKGGNTARCFVQRMQWEDIKKVTNNQKRHTNLVKQSIETWVDGRGVRKRREEI